MIKSSYRLYKAKHLEDKIPKVDFLLYDHLEIMPNGYVFSGSIAKLDIGAGFFFGNAKECIATTAVDRLLKKDKLESELRKEFPELDVLPENIKDADYVFATQTGIFYLIRASHEEHEELSWGRNKRTSPKDKLWFG